VGALVVVAVVFALHEINRPFTRGHHGWSAALRSLIGQNYIDHGFFATKFTPYKDFGSTGPTDAMIHWHHPPTINVLVGLSRSVIGESELGTNAVGALFYLLVVLAFLFTVWRRHGPGVAAASTSVLLAIPLHFEWGRLLNYEPPIAALTLVAIHLAHRSREAEGRRRLVLQLECALTLAVAGSFDWPGFILAGFVGFDALAREPRRPTLFLLIGVVTTATLAAWMWWAVTMAGGLDEVLGVAEWRGSSGHRWSELAGRQVTRLIDYLGAPVLLASIAGAIAGTMRRRDLDPIFSVFVGGSVVYFAAFQQAAWVHVFYIYFFAPAAALGAGMAVDSVYEAVSRRWDRSRARAAGTLALVVLVGSAFALFPTTHRRSYSILPPKQPPRGFPIDGGIDDVEVGRLVARITEPDELVVYHPSVSAFQTRITADRQFRRSRRKGPTPGAKAWVAPRRLVDDARLRQLASKHEVYTLAGHVVVDQNAESTGLVGLEMRTTGSDPLHWFFTSSVIPAYEVVEVTPKDAQRHKKSM
jgi:hypothetical protein